jgi:hypothetical protein
MGLRPYRPNEFSYEGQRYIALREVVEKLKERVLQLSNSNSSAFERGVRAAAAFAGERFDAECKSNFKIEDIVLAKLNFLDNDKIRTKTKKVVAKKRKSVKRKK